MLILDTDHISELRRGSPLAQVLLDRLGAAKQQIGTTIISIEEHLRGRLAQTARARDPQRAIQLYGRLQEFLQDLPQWLILPWDQKSAELFRDLQSQRLGVGTMDLKIASIVLANGAKLLSRNLRDFERIPKLDVEDWLA